MSDAHGAVTFSDEERAHLESFGREGLGEATPPVADNQREEHDDNQPGGEPPGAKDDQTDATADADPDVDADLDGDDDDQGDNRKKPRRVHYRQFVKERSAKEEATRRAEDLHRQLLEAQRNQAVLSERMRAFAEHQQRQQHEAQQRAAAAAAAQQGQDPRIRPEPDPNQDPMGHIAWLRDQHSLMQEEVGRMRQGFTQAAQQQQQMAVQQEVANFYRSDHRAAVNEYAPYQSAYEHMIKVAEANIMAQYGGRLTKQQLEHEVRQQEMGLADAARQRGMRPAQIVLQMARNTGWRDPAPEQPQPAQPDPVAAQAQIDAAARAQDQNRSLSSAGRPGGGSSAMTIDKFARMSPDEANAWMNANPDAFARLAGQQ